jgi:hypothetical protein
MLFANLQRAAIYQAEELAISTDRTYNIHFGGWVLVDIGAESVEFDQGEYLHHFGPWTYMFVRSESTFAYEWLFPTIVAAGASFFNADITPAIVSINHAEGIASAAQAVWPRSTVITCWPHLVRNCRKQSSLLKDTAAYENAVKDHIYNLHTAGSHEQFTAMAKVTVQHWKAMDEGAFATWFEEVYLTEHWAIWHVAASGIPGVLPNQQSIKSHHSVIKLFATENRKTPTAAVLILVVPRLLLHGGMRLANDPIRHYNKGTCAVRVDG